MIALLLMCGITGLACQNKPRRTMRPAEVQSYDLPPMTAKRFEEPPVYPDEKLTLPSQKKPTNGMAPPAGLGGGGGMNGGMGGGVPGTNPGSLGGFQ